MPINQGLGPSDFYNTAYNQAQQSRELDMRMQEMRQQQMYQNLMLQQQMMNTQATVAHTNAETTMLQGGGPGAMAFRNQALINGVDPSSLPPLPYGNASNGGAPAPALDANGIPSYASPSQALASAMGGTSRGTSGGIPTANSPQGGGAMIPAQAPQSWRQNAGRPAAPIPQSVPPSGSSPMLSDPPGFPAPGSMAPPASAATPSAASIDPETDSALGLGSYASQPKGAAPAPSPSPQLSAAMPQGSTSANPGGSLMPPGMTGNLPPQGSAPAAQSPAGPSFANVQYNPSDFASHYVTDPATNRVAGKFSFLSPQEVEFTDPMGNVTRRQTSMKMDQGYDTPAAAVDYERQNGLSGGTVEKNQFGKYDIKGAAPMPQGASVNAEQAANVMKLKDHFDMLPQIREASDAVGAYNQLTSSINTKTGMADKLSQEAMQRLINPRMAVSMAAQKGAPSGFANWVSNLPQNIATGASIPDDVRKFIAANAKTLMENGRAAVQAQIGSHMYLANSMGIPQDVAAKSFVNPYDSVAQPADEPPPSPAAQNAAAQQVLIKYNGGGYDANPTRKAEAKAQLQRLNINVP